MKIVYCIAATYNSGGMERVLCAKANYWAEQGQDVYIVTTDQKGRQSFFQFDEKITFMDLGVNYEETNGQSFFKKTRAFFRKQILHRQRLEKCLKEIRADIVVSMFNNEVSFLPSIDDGSKKVLEIHFSKNKKLLYGRKGLWRLADLWRTKREESYVKAYDRFVVLTRQDAESWGEVENMEVIPNPRTFQASHICQLSSKNVLAIGRFEYQKGFDRLIEIWKFVSEQRPDWHLNIVGQGELKEELLRQISDLGLTSSVNLLPPNSNVEQLYLDASIYAMTSRYEGLPMVLLEAQACGLPIVSYDLECGPRDIIHEGIDGFLVKEGDAESFANKLLVLMEDTEMRQSFGKSAKEYSASFAMESILPKWEQLFFNLVKK